MFARTFLYALLTTAGCAVKDATSQDTSTNGVQKQERLTSNQAAELMASAPGELHLNDLKTLGIEVAKQLGQYRGWLCLDGLPTITEDEAQVLAESKSIIGLSLGGLTDISPALATILATKQGTLMLDGLKRISDQAGRALAKHRGRLSANSLEELNGSVLNALCEHAEEVDLDHVRRHVVELSDVRLSALLARGALGHSEFTRLRAITAEAAEAVGENSGSLALPALESLSADVARGLIQTKYSLFLPGVETVDEATAKELSESREVLPDLFMNGLRSLTPEAALWLGRKRGALVLTGLESLTPDAAKNLAQHTGGPLVLTGVHSLTPEVAAHLARKSGWMFLGCTEAMDPKTARALTGGTANAGITFTRLTSLSGELAESLVANEHRLIDFPALTRDSIKPSVSAAFANAKCGLLRLSGITELSPELARDIGFYKCRLELTNLSVLSPEQAELLAVNQSFLELPLIDTLSEEAATALAGHQGRLVLHAPSLALLRRLESHSGTLWLKSPTHKQRNVLGRSGLLNALMDWAEYHESLSRHKGPIILQDVSILSEKAAVALAGRDSPTDLTWLKHGTTEPGLRALRTSKKVVLPEELR